MSTRRAPRAGPGGGTLRPAHRRSDSPPAERLDPPAEHLDPPPAEHPDRGPVWTGDTLPDNRPDVSTVPQAQWDDPRHDSSSLQYDGTPLGEHGYVGTVNPDELSPSRLTNSGRLIHPNVVPPKLQPYIDSGAIINDNGVLRLSEPVEVTFTLKNPNHDLAELLRQGDLLERSLNQQSVGDWQERINSYDLNGRVEGPAQTSYRAGQIQLQADALEVRNLPSSDAALAAAKKKAEGLRCCTARTRWPAATLCSSPAWGIVQSTVPTGGVGTRALIEKACFAKCRHPWNRPEYPISCSATYA